MLIVVLYYYFFEASSLKSAFIAATVTNIWISFWSADNFRTSNQRWYGQAKQIMSAERFLISQKYCYRQYTSALTTTVWGRCVYARSKEEKKHQLFSWLVKKKWRGRLQY